MKIIPSYNSSFKNGFNPTFSPYGWQIPTSDLVAWYDPSRLSLSNNTAIASLADLSGTGNDLSQGTAGLRPSFRTNALNNENCLNFNLDRISRAGVSMSSAPGFTHCAVFDYQGSSGIQNIVFLSSNTPNTSRFVLRMDASNQIALGIRRLDTDVGVSVYTASITYRGIMVAVATIDYPTGVANLYLNNSLAVTQATGLIGAECSATAPGFYGLGGSSVTNNLVSNLGEVMTYRRVITATERVDITTYLMTKYSIGAIGVS